MPRTPGSSGFPEALSHTAAVEYAASSHAAKTPAARGNSAAIHHTVPHATPTPPAPHSDNALRTLGPPVAARSRASTETRVSPRLVLHLPSSRSTPLRP